MLGVEFVEDRKSKRHAVELRDRIVMNCVFEQKLWVLGDREERDTSAARTDYRRRASNGGSDPLRASCRT